MNKPVIKYKILRQSQEVGGKFYAVVDNANTVPASIAMQQIIEYKKLYNQNPKQLAQIVEDVLQGAAELVARDGLPRNVSSLLKFEARIKGTFDNSEAGVTVQRAVVSPRMLKDIRIDIDKADFSFANQNDNTAPRIIAAALESDLFRGWSAANILQAGSEAVNVELVGPLTLSGDRLCPNGWTADCKLAVSVYRNGLLVGRIDGVTSDQEGTLGLLVGGTPDTASVNAIVVTQRANVEPPSVAWTYDEDGTTILPVPWTPSAGDVIEFAFSRTLTDGSESVVESVKRVTLTA